MDFYEKYKYFDTVQMMYCLEKCQHFGMAGVMNCNGKHRKGVYLKKIHLQAELQ